MRDAYSDQLDSIFDDLADDGPRGRRPSVRAPPQALLDRRRRDRRAGHQRRRRRSTRPASGSRSTAFELLSLQQPVAGDLRMLVVGAADGQRARADGRPLGARRQDRPAARPRGRRARRGSCRRSPRMADGRRGHGRAGSPRIIADARRRGRHRARGGRRGDGPAAPLVASAQLLGDDWQHGVEAAVDIALLGRYYERIADHAVSMASRVVFLVTGETVPSGSSAL